VSRTVLRRGVPALLVIAALVAVRPAVALVEQHPYFALREVAIRGHRRLTSDRVRTVAGIEAGMSAWDVDADAVEGRLRAEPWVRAARVRRELPHRVVVHIREHRPVAILATAGKRPALYYVSKSGEIFAQVGEGDRRDLPWVTGLRAADLRAGDALGERAIRRALALVRTARRPGSGVEAVSEVWIDRTRGLTLLPVRPAVPIEVGWDEFADKLARLRRVLALWAGRERELGRVSLLFADEVVVRKPGAGTPAPRRAARS
jgi:cell division protein FtsQ